MARRAESSQLSLGPLLVLRGRGGKRAGAGRKRSSTLVPHTTRASFAARFPQHVTLRLARGIQLRTPALLAIVHAVMATSHRDEFRITDFNCESNHMHLVAEASGRTALARGLQRFKSRLARGINLGPGRRGAVFHYHHTRALRPPREVRHVLRYVLNNARHHAADRGRALDPAWFDPFSSAPWFTGWSTPLMPYSGWTYELMRRAPPTAEPTVWLLAVGWRRRGRIAPREVPGVRASRGACRRRSGTAAARRTGRR